LLDSLKEFPETTLIFTMPNADVGNFEIKKQIEEFVEARENAHVFTSLGYQKYLSLMKIVDAVIGNSSSGLMEAPSVGVPTINIGSRQKGRSIATSVINCTSKTDEISKAIRKLYSPEFQVQLTDIENPYGLPGSSQKIVSVLAEISLDGLIRKVFYDL
jgi:UDP-hydrolysing UDP-N-acetyl-D-glucosamine 2-epimerase